MKRERKGNKQGIYDVYGIYPVFTKSFKYLSNIYQVTDAQTTRKNANRHHT